MDMDILPRVDDIWRERDEEAGQEGQQICLENDLQDASTD
jgi:hypothetical protein